MQARDQPGEVAVAASAPVGSVEQQQQQQQQQQETTSAIEPQSHQVEQHSEDADSSSDLALASKPLKATLSKLSEQPSVLRQQSLAGLSVLSSFSVCRICHVGSWPKEPLISPCRCKGTLAYVHLTCLERWLNQSCRNYCELCNFRYNALETPRYKWFESLRIWVNHPRNRRHIKEDFLIFTLLTVFTAGLASICLLGNRHFVLEGSRVGFSETWTKGAIIFFMFIVISGYGASVYFLIKVMPWYNWWRGTVNIRLHFDPSSASSLEVEMPQRQQQYNDPTDER